MHTRQHHDLAFAHQQHAQLHRYHAEAHQQQAMFHHQQATFHQNQAINQPAYNEKATAFNNQVSPAALVFQGHVSPQAIQSLNQYFTPYPNPNMSMSPQIAHTTDNQNSLQRGTKF
ncbi:hypothetical protein [Brevibacillus choshinensis]|uniref:hypothetical protein n=1 Tax=Brevibacillus choshinensis TaxID=54911 RepID=UPI002E1F1FB4|nr:hypothetical protein [Brevibacillus choshinensis]MED4783941.1 hypothetical protein [Brevibacillus choshinensis]